MWLPAAWRKGMWAIVVALCALASAQAADGDGAKRILVMGDSLSAAYGLAAREGWVALLGDKLVQDRSGWRVVNASVSGETTAGGASRIDAALKEHVPSLVVIELGANDALRGLPLEQASANLERMIAASQTAGANVLLIGIRIPPNYGPDYAAALEKMYADLAAKHGTGLLPFLLEPIAADRANFQADNLHPIAAAQPKLMEHVWGALAPMLVPQSTR
jgi:acyl-CoA thioesterase-1